MRMSANLLYELESMLQQAAKKYIAACVNGRFCIELYMAGVLDTCSHIGAMDKSVSGMSEKNDFINAFRESFWKYKGLCDSGKITDRELRYKVYDTVYDLFVMHLTPKARKALGLEVPDGCL